MKTFEIRVTNKKDQNHLKNYIYKYRHWQNVLTLIVINLDYAIVRACIANTKGDRKRTKRELFKDIIIDKLFNADLNGAVNHIKLAVNRSFKWLKNNLWKVCNPIKVKSSRELHNLICNIRSNKSLSVGGKTEIYERRTTACAYRYSIT